MKILLAILLVAFLSGCASYGPRYGGYDGKHYVSKPYKTYPTWRKR